jgi:hypothetical protein
MVWEKVNLATREKKTLAKCKWIHLKFVVCLLSFNLFDGHIGWRIDSFHLLLFHAY